VDDEIEAAELAHGVLYQLLCAGATAKVAVGATGRDDSPPVALEPRCDRASDPAGTARDQRASVR